jgi:hypothetical protein
MRSFEDKDVQRAILHSIAAKPTNSITNAELRLAVANRLATEPSPAFLRAYRRNVRRMLLDGTLAGRNPLNTVVEAAQ